MKKILPLLLAAGIIFISSACGDKKESTENYVNPVFKENLNEVFEVIKKRFIVDFADVKTKFGEPVQIEIDSLQNPTDERFYDSTFVFTYKTVAFHFQKRARDKVYFLTGLDLNGEFKAKQFTITKDMPREDFLILFGQPAFTSTDEALEELTYAIYKDEEGAFYDSFKFYFVEGKFIGLKYSPYLEIYPVQEGEESGQGQ